MRFRTLLSLALTGTLATAVATTVATPADANGFGLANGCCPFADNAKHWYNYATLETRTRDAVKYAMLNLDAQSDITVAADTTPDASTDTEHFDRYYVDHWDLDWDGSSSGYNLYAFAKCVKYWPRASDTAPWLCDQYEVRYDLADVDRFTTTQRKALACHEVGHTVGLDHSNESSSCMRTGAHTTVKLSSHDVAHINGRY